MIEIRREEKIERDNDRYKERGKERVREFEKKRASFLKQIFRLGVRLISCPLTYPLI